jgi:hypothetical protein
VIVKLIPLLVPFLILILIKLAKSHILSTLFTKKTTQKSKEMISCDSCGTFVHEDLLISRFGKKYCSKECTNS